MIWVSLDIEADGPIPFLNSMLQLGAVAVDDDGKEVGSWSACFKPLPDARADERTIVEFWNAYPGMLERVLAQAEEPALMTKEFVEWVEGLGERRKAVCWPASFDYPFIHGYCVKFTGNCPLGFSAVDIGSYAAGVLGRAPGLGKRHMPNEWTDGLPPHTHDALDDAREQAELFCRIKKAAVDKEQLRARLAREQVAADMARARPKPATHFKLTTYDYGEELLVPKRPITICRIPKLDTTNGKPGLGSRIYLDGVGHLVRESPEDILRATGGSL